VKNVIHKRKSKAVSGILGAIMLFAMLFTTGSSYFLFIVASQQIMNSAHLDAGYVQNDRALERFSLASLKTSTGKIGINITNLGPNAINIVRIIVSNSSNVYELNGGSGVGYATIPNLPTYINAGTRKDLIDTQLTPTSSITYTIKVLTDKGNIAVVGYPDGSSAYVVAQSIISQGIGDVQLGFQEFKYANIDAGTPLTWNRAANVSKNVNAMFKVILINHSIKDIYVGARSSISLIRTGSSSTTSFFLVKTISNSSGTATPMGGTDYIKIPANPGNIAQGGTPTTIYFAATTIGGSTIQSTPSQSDIWYVLIGLTGTYTATSSSDTYSQLIPFKTIYIL
jgi:hypothetical protein